MFSSVSKNDVYISLIMCETCYNQRSKNTWFTHRYAEIRHKRFILCSFHFLCFPLYCVTYLKTKRICHTLPPVVESYEVSLCGLSRIGNTTPSPLLVLIGNTHNSRSSPKTSFKFLQYPRS